MILGSVLKLEFEFAGSMWQLAVFLLDSMPLVHVLKFHKSSRALVWFRAKGLAAPI